MSDYSKFTTMLASEFHRYLMEDEEKARLMPDNAIIVFQVDGEDDFNHWHKEMTLRNREAGQAVTYVHLKKWRLHSVIEDMTLIGATA
jgi:hypothetical protein